MKVKISIGTVTEQIRVIKSLPPVLATAEGSSTVVKKPSKSVETIGYRVIIKVHAEDDPSIVLGEKEVYVKDGTEEEMKESIKQEARSWWQEIRQVGDKKQKVQICLQDAVDELSYE